MNPEFPSVKILLLFGFSYLFLFRCCQFFLFSIKTYSTSLIKIWEILVALDPLKRMVCSVERSDPKDLFTLFSIPSFRHTGDSNSCPPDLELGALTEWLARRMLIYVSWQASIHCSLQNPIVSALGYRELAMGK
jgi:hypothetical protein